MTHSEFTSTMEARGLRLECEGPFFQPGWVVRGDLNQIPAAVFDVIKRNETGSLKKFSSGWAIVFQTPGFEIFRDAMIQTLH